MGNGKNNFHKNEIIYMAQKKPFMLRIDPDILKALEKWAVDEFRSTNSQIEWLLSKALKEAGRIKSKGKTD